MVNFFGYTFFLPDNINSNGAGGGCLRGGGARHHEEGRGGFGGGHNRGGGGGRGRFIPVKPTQSPLSIPFSAQSAGKLEWKRSGKEMEQPLQPPMGIPPGKEFRKKIPITVNSVPCEVQLPELCFYQYDVDIALSKECRQAKLDRKSGAGGAAACGSSLPHSRGKTKEKELVNPKLWKKIVTVLIRKVEKLEGGTVKIASDYSKALYTTKELTCTSGDNFTLMIEGKDLDDDTENAKDLYEITVKLSATIQTGEARDLVPNLKAACQARKTLPGNLTDIERVVNVALKTVPSTTFIPVGRSSFFDPPQLPQIGYKIGEGVVNLTGHSLIFTMGWKNFINVDSANSAFVMGSKVNDFLLDVFMKNSNSRGNSLGNINPLDVTTWSKEDFEKIEKLLKTIKVSFRTGSGTPQESRIIRKVRELLPRPAVEQSFTADGEVMNVQFYYEVVHNRRLNYRNGLCLLLGKTSIVPAEFCTIVAGQSYNKKLSDAQTAAMIKDTAKTPRDRQLFIEGAIRRCNFRDDPVLNEFGMTVGTRLHKMNARVLDTPELIYRNPANKQCVMIQPGMEGEWSHPSGMTFYEPAKDGKPIRWTVLEIKSGVHNRLTREIIQNFVQKMIFEGSKMGLNLGDDKPVMAGYRSFPMKNVRYLHVELNKTHLDSERNPMYDFILVVLPTKDTDTYAYIKSRTEVEGYMNFREPGKNPILTQCVQASNVERYRPAVVENIIRKLNTKLGGVNHMVRVGCLNIFDMPILIIGADVTHPQAGSKIPSIAAVTASIDRSCSHFGMQCKAQQKASRNAAEVIQQLEEMVRKFIMWYVNMTKHKPRKIIVLRDGVGDGQFAEVLQTEMMEIRRACQSLSSKIFEKAVKDHEAPFYEKTGNKYEPKITFMAVQKRHKTRFFVNNPEDGVGGPKNVPPGTVVDTDIVNPRTTDFYTVSHTGIQGCSKPSRYQVLWDDSDFTSDELQALNYHLCYGYARCNRSVSYPAPTYYAHSACTRAKNYVQTFSNDELENLDTVNEKLRRHVSLDNGDYRMHYI